MTSKLFIAFLKDIVLAAKNGGLEGTAESRGRKVARLYGPNYFASVIRLLRKVKPEDLLNQLVSAKENIGREAGGSGKSDLLDAFDEFLTVDFTAILDKIQVVPQKATPEDLSKTSKDSQLARAVSQIIDSVSRESLSREIANFHRRFSGKSQILVQTAYPPEENFTTLVRKMLSKKYPGSYAIFTIDRDLLGGLRIYESGRLIDSSWLLSINTIRQLQHNLS